MKPPALPIAPKEYTSDYINGLTRILTQYLNGEAGGRSTENRHVATATAATHAIPASQARIKNDIRNGQFRIAQRGTSFVSPANAAYDIDGYACIYSSAALVTVAQVGGSSTGKFARQVTVGTIDASIAAGDYFSDRQKIEGYRIVKYIGNTFTIAFRAKVPVSGIHCVALVNGGSDRSYVSEINFPSANVWQDCSVTVAGGLPTAGAWNYTTGIGLSVTLSHACGSTYQTTADAWQTGLFLSTANQVNDLATVGNVWAMEDVRMCLGTYCPPDDQTYEEDLAECERYLPAIRSQAAISYIANGQCYSISAAYIDFPFKVTPRVVPTGISVSGQGHFSLHQANTTGVAATAIAFANSGSLSQGLVELTGASGLVAGNATRAYFNTASGYLLFTGCEL